MSQTASGIRQSTDGPGTVVDRAVPMLTPCEAKLIARIRNDWAVDYGAREIQLVIEYQDRTPVLIRITMNTVKEEKLR